MASFALTTLKLAVLHGPDLAPQFTKHSPPPGLLLEKHCEPRREKVAAYGEHWMRDASTSWSRSTPDNRRSAGFHCFDPSELVLASCF